MKGLGKIGDIQVAYQQEKEGKDGGKYCGERYTIFFEIGDDVHRVDSGWLHCQSQNGGLEILKRRGIYVGAQGEMTIRYGFRDWNGKRFSECELVRFNNLSPKQDAKPEQKDDEQPQQPAQEAEPAPAAQAAEVELKDGETSDLPF